MTISRVIFVDDYQPIQTIMTADYQGRDEETAKLRSRPFSVYPGSAGQSF